MVAPPAARGDREPLAADDLPPSAPTALRGDRDGPAQPAGTTVPGRAVRAPATPF